MAYLEVDLWPTAAVLLCTGAAIAVMRLLERRADRLAALRTREALRQTLADPTQE